MIRIGILGSENSHATQFSRIFNGFDPLVEEDYSDVRVVAAGGNYPEESKKLLEAYGLEFVVDDPKDMLGKIDALMVTARDGKYHLGFARPFVEAGIPCFIDKPFTNGEEDALELARLAKKKNVPLAGGSSLKLVYDTKTLRYFARAHQDALQGGNAAAPVSMENEYGDFYFYSHHLAEMSMTIFGYTPKSVLAFRNGKNVTAVARYDNYDVTNHWNEANYGYSATVYAGKANAHREMDAFQGYQIEAADFIHMVRSGKMHLTYEELINPVYYINAVKKSYETGVEVKLNFPVI